ncbi:MAG: UDP-N-acetylmuramate--L-alanine ligase [SAR116 cluster bacterium]|nr:UDP-N-acetylmuramate--L-alanine ligase [SAR116 cluster bacterium]RPH11123.1 MAG: UDP-N-acetylmuramate--L-alanine ligase [Alphaproteobacteria bacterium TMED54]
MINIPKNFGFFHFIGIGGIGMSGIAEILLKSGYQVQGSDLSSSKIVSRLISLGAKISIGHDKKQIQNASIVIFSSAIKQNNPELIEAKKLFIPIIHRSEMLGELMKLKKSIAIAGTHGKTTTTSLVSKILDTNKMDPTIINGGIISSLASNAKLGQGEWMVVEADESDGSFSKLMPTIAIITNIDLEHLDFHKTEKNLENAFINFMSSIPFYGLCSVCIDHPRVQKIFSNLKNRKIISYGLSPNADVRGTNIITKDEKMYFDVTYKNKSNDKMMTIKNIAFSMLGLHNIQNALASISVALQLNIDIKIIKTALKNFNGVQRRFQLIDTYKKSKIIDDYGHHPEEIKAALSATKLLKRNSKVLAIFQPHRYSRLKNHFNEFCSCFNDADEVVLLNVYPAGEKKMNNFESINLENGIRNYGHKNVNFLKKDDDIYKFIFNKIDKYEIIIFLGAGNITKIANNLKQELKNLENC